MNNATALVTLLAIGAGFDGLPVRRFKSVVGASVDGYCACETPNVNRRDNCRRCHKRVARASQ